jgi:hypothetical protein
MSDKEVSRYSRERNSMQRKLLARIHELAYQKAYVEASADPKWKRYLYGICYGTSARRLLTGGKV